MLNQMTKLWQLSINKYRIKCLESNIPLKFTYNQKPLDPSLTLSASGLRNNSVIVVEKTNLNIDSPVIPQSHLTLIFQRQGNYQLIPLQIESSKTVGDAIIAYKNKIGLSNSNERFIYLLDSKTLRENITLDQAGLKNCSKILVVTTKNL